MGRPLLTDEMIERANRGESFDDAYLDNQDTQIFTDLSDSLNVQLDDDSPYTYKSRRIENAKRGAFQSKLNKILVVILILLAILIYAIFKL